MPGEVVVSSQKVLVQVSLFLQPPLELRNDFTLSNGTVEVVAILGQFDFPELRREDLLPRSPGQRVAQVSPEKLQPFWDAALAAATKKVERLGDFFPRWSTHRIVLNRMSGKFEITGTGAHVVYKDITLSQGSVPKERRFIVLERERPWTQDVWDRLPVVLGISTVHTDEFPSILVLEGYCDREQIAKFIAEPFDYRVVVGEANLLFSVA